MSKRKVTIGVFIRSWIFWLIMGGLIPVYNLLSLPLFLVNTRLRHKIMLSWAHIFTWMAKYVCGIKYEVKGQENIKEWPAIIASNHQSMWETMSLNTIFPSHVWIAKRELTKIPFFGWGMLSVSPIAIDRSQGASSLQQILHQSKNRMQKGFGVLVFPEGTRVRAGDTKAYKTGVARMATSLNLPIYPVAHNAGYCIPKNSFYLYPGLVTVIIGTPISSIGKDAVELTLEIENTINGELNQLPKN